MALCVSSASSTLFTGLAPLQARNKAAALARPKASHFFSCSCSSSSPPPDNGVSPHSSGEVGRGGAAVEASAAAKEEEVVRRLRRVQEEKVGLSIKDETLKQIHLYNRKIKQCNPTAKPDKANIDQLIQTINMFLCQCGLLHSIEHANKHLVKLALATAVAGVLAFTPTGDALAAKSGGRVGGQAFRSGPSPSAPRPSPSAPRADNSRRTNIYVNPPSYGAPPLLGGYGSPYYGGGWGWSPFSFFAPGPSIAVGTGGGLGFLVVLVLLTMSVSVLNFIRRRDDDDYYD